MTSRRLASDGWRCSRRREPSNGGHGVLGGTGDLEPDDRPDPAIHSPPGRERVDEIEDAAGLLVELQVHASGGSNPGPRVGDLHAYDIGGEADGQAGAEPLGRRYRAGRYWTTSSLVSRWRSRMSSGGNPGSTSTSALWPLGRPRGSHRARPRTRAGSSRASVPATCSCASSTNSSRPVEPGDEEYAAETIRLRALDLRRSRPPPWRYRALRRIGRLEVPRPRRVPPGARSRLTPRLQASCRPLCAGSRGNPAAATERSVI